MKRKTSKFLSFLLASALAFSNVPITNVFAADSTSVDFEMLATDIDIVVPLNFTVSIDPNLPYNDGGFVYASNIYVQNNTVCPISLGIVSFEDESNTFENDILPDGLPNGLEWDNLNVSQTKKYFALGIKASDTNEWLNYNFDDTVYTKVINENNGLYFGDIGTKESIHFDLEAFYGRANKEAKNFSYKITWIVELCEGED